MGLTDEQQAVVEASLTHHMVLVPSPAGSGKSTLLEGVAEAHNNKNCLYLVFNKEMQIEARGRFNSNVKVSTSSALAYHYVVRLGNRKFEPHFSTSQINEKDVSKRDKEKVVFWFDKFCQSKYLSISEYCATEPKAMKRIELIKKYMNLMVTCKIPSNFSFNMKYFHHQLSKGKIDLDLKLLMLDEIQDSSPVVLEIFKLIKAKHKVGVGDPHQMLYSFASATNGFNYLQDQNPHILRLTKSFRVTVEVAKKIEQFGRLYLEPDFEFKGTDGGVDNGLTAYLSRSNSALISRMVELHRTKTPYRLTRTVASIFEAVKVIMYLNKKGVYNPRYEFLNRGINDYFEGKTRANSLISHIKEEFHYHSEIQSAINIVIQLGSRKLKETMELATKYAKLPQYKAAKTLIATSYTTKGMTISTVHIDKDVLPKAKLLDLTIKDRTIQETEALNLLYVATSRSNGQQDTTLLDYAINYKLQQNTKGSTKEFRSNGISQRHCTSNKNITSGTDDFGDPIVKKDGMYLNKYTGDYTREAPSFTKFLLEGVLL